MSEHDIAALNFSPGEIILSSDCSSDEMPGSIDTTTPVDAMRNVEKFFEVRLVNPFIIDIGPAHLRILSCLEC
jgi:hypothetical protein